MRKYKAFRSWLEVLDIWLRETSGKEGEGEEK